MGEEHDKWVGALGANMNVASVGGGTTWNAPFDLGSCDNTADASRNLVDIQKEKLGEWRDIGFAQEFALVDKGIANQLKAFSAASRPLSADDVKVLVPLGLMAVQARDNALKNLGAAITAELDKYTGAGADDAMDSVSELLHQEFLKGDGSNKIAELNELVGKAKTFSGDVKKYVGYAEKTKSFIKSAAKLEDISKALEEFKGKMEDAEKALEIASDIAVLAGKVDQRPGDTANSISQMRAGLRIADFVMSKTTVPVIGQWWSGYIKPCAELALKRLEKLDEMIDKSTRGLLADEWWQNASKGMNAPIISDSGLNGALLSKTFPGGQPMLDFMWSLFRGRLPDSVPDAVKKYMLKFRKQFNAGQPEGDQLETDAAWYNAWDAFSDEDSPNLKSWIVKNKESVWAMQYGALPHP